jgi:flagellar motility protein MotE (MotC chaperone)
MAKHKETQPEQLNDQVIDLELDFKDRGGKQRFKKVSDFENWLAEEYKFWEWLRKKPANTYFGRTNLNNTFFQYHEECSSHLARAKNDWNNPSQQLHRLLSLPEEEQNEAHSNEIEGHEKQCANALDALKQNLRSSMGRRGIDAGHHIFKHEPEAQFINNLAEHDITSAVFALEFFVKASSNAEEVLRPNGHILASLYREGLDPSTKSSENAFKEVIATWTRELEQYKERYEALKSDYESLKRNNRQVTKNWTDKTVDMEEQFSTQLSENKQNLANLTETYESHMVLKAPVKYWSTKRKGHAILIKRLRGWLVKSAIGGALAIGIGAYLLLPQFHPADEIPWRQLGLFLLLSTFILWGVRLCVKLLLSNIHLEADAREREVMIQTFMAMMRHKESREGVTKENIAVVLAPIFSPSTSGVIKDDGGPSSLTDFITRMTGK